MVRKTTPQAGNRTKRKVVRALPRAFEPPAVDVASSIDDILARHPAAQAVFVALPPSHRREFIDWVKQARQQSTRLRRLDKMIQMLLAKRL